MSNARWHGAHASIIERHGLGLPAMIEYEHTGTSAAQVVAKSRD